MPETPFDAWAEFYDSTVPEDRPDRALYLDLCADVDGPVLELACGTGDVYLDLLDAGVDAYGLDASAAMLDVLREHAAARGLEPRVRRADMADFSPETFDRSFELIIAPVNAVRHLPDPTDQRAAFRNVRDCLADGGRFAFWVDLPDYDALCAQRDGETTVDPFVHDGETYEFERRVELGDPVRGTLDYRFAFRRRATGGVVASTAFEMVIVPKGQFDLLLAGAGFAGWTYYNGADLAPLTTTAEPVVCIARR